MARAPKWNAGYRNSFVQLANDFFAGFTLGAANCTVVVRRVFATLDGEVACARDALPSHRSLITPMLAFGTNFSMFICLKNGRRLRVSDWSKVSRRAPWMRKVLQGKGWI